MEGSIEIVYSARIKKMKFCLISSKMVFQASQKYHRVHVSRSSCSKFLQPLSWLPTSENHVSIPESQILRFVEVCLQAVVSFAEGRRTSYWSFVGMEGVAPYDRVCVERYE